MLIKKQKFAQKKIYRSRFIYFNINLKYHIEIAK